MARGTQQRVAGRFLKLFLHSGDERSALLEEVSPRLDRGRVEFLDGPAREHRLVKILAHHIEPVLAGCALQLGAVRTERRFKLLLVPHDDGRDDVQVAAHRVDRDRQLRQRAHRDDLAAVDRKSGTASRGDSLLDTIQGRVPHLDPLRTLGGIPRDFAAAVDVSGELRAQVKVRRRGDRRGMPAEVSCYGAVELAARCRDGIEPRVLARLKVFGNRTVIGDQLRHHRAGAASERLVLRLHAVDGLHRLEGGPFDQQVTGEHDGRDGREAEEQAGPNPHAQPHTPRTACRRLLRRRLSRADCRLSGGFVHTT